MLTVVQQLVMFCILGRKRNFTCNPGKAPYCVPAQAEGPTELNTPFQALAASQTSWHLAACMLPRMLCMLILHRMQNEQMKTAHTVVGSSTL